VAVWELGARGYRIGRAGIGLDSEAGNMVVEVGVAGCTLQEVDVQRLVLVAVAAVGISGELQGFRLGGMSLQGQVSAEMLLDPDFAHIPSTAL